MSPTPTILNGESLNIPETNQAKLKQLFPSVFTETIDENGQTISSIDFEKLRAELGNHSDIWDNRRERYTTDWPGKKDALKTIQATTKATLKPDRDESINFDTTQNLYIEGDNLEVLKLLQKSYYNKVKMIYIDPPYNTGKEFIYPDNYSQSLENYLSLTGQTNEAGQKLSTNTQNEGRYHTNWLNMMYPRLYLARNLLKEDGVIFVSIDDHEVTNLRKLMDEIFGEENFVALLPTVMNLKGNPDAYGFTDTHEYTLVYSKNKAFCLLGEYDVDELGMNDWSEDEYGLYKKADTLRRTGQDASRQKRPKGWFPIFITENNEVYSSGDDKPRNSNDEVLLPINDEGEELSWTWSKEKINSEGYNLIVINGRNNKKNVYKKQRPQLGDLPTKKPKSIFYKPEYSSSTATTELKNLLGKKLFEGPKPAFLLADFIKIGTERDSIILDFFSGSGTTAHAVLDLNKADGGNRKFIMVQLPEKCDESSEAYKAGYKTIAEIGKERIRRVIQKLDVEGVKNGDGVVKNGDEGIAATGVDPLFQDDGGVKNGDGMFSHQDRGFKVFKLSNSNFKQWQPMDPNATEDEIKQQILDFVEHIDPATTSEYLLYEILLKSGFSLTEKIEILTLAGKRIYRT